VPTISQRDERYQIAYMLRDMNLSERAARTFLRKRMYAATEVHSILRLLARIVPEVR
jgi:hypothetical protein